MLGKIKIGTKIAFLVVAISLVGLTMSIFGSHSIMKVDAAYSDLIENPSKAALSLARVNRMINQIGYGMYRTVAYDGDEAKKAYAIVERAAGEVQTYIDDVQARAPEDAARWNDLEPKIQSVVKSALAAAKLGVDTDSGSPGNDQAKAEMAKLDPMISSLTESITAVNKARAQVVDTRSDALSDQSGRTATILLVTSLVSALAGLAGALFLSAKGITGPLSLLGRRMGELAAGQLDTPVEGLERGDEVGAMARAVQVFKDAANRNRRLEVEAREAREAQALSRDRQVAIDNAKAEDLKAFVHGVEAGFERLAAGDLTVRMDGQVAPEFEPIRQRFNASVAQLEDTIGSVIGSVGTIRVGLCQITVAAGDLSQRTEQQAASLEETVAALSEVMRGVDRTAQGADEVRAAATLAQAEAEKGGQVVGRAVAAMGEIERSSGEIGRIISVIDEIAFQTNLLALNAGVEAARAGEAGRGFAVVAQEVRGLAQRSAEAAREIKDLIATSSAKVEEGVELVSASGRALDGIVGQVGGVAAGIAEIAREAREQAVSLKEVSTAADQMDKVTQQNAAMVEETTAAAQSLSAETQTLAEITERFRTSRGMAPAAAGKPATRAPSRAVSRAPAAPVRQMRQTAQAQTQAATDNWEEF